ncbi:hypothetical protein N7537_006827 [Penicillium hordei]|uniref:Uncharacterized protein n=1 Tax=Penicillium hordei TaxID=40994 RepID=A0AAD6E8R6_9EURO|nr:uncharacterized protein N7537_006827 [Penicillium hordei]KAJ5603871.1 hypothetical protein N7537_006827 [Penicillium hordei]
MYIQFFKDNRPHSEQIIDGELLQTLHYEILGEFQNLPGLHHAEEKPIMWTLFVYAAVRQCGSV